MKNSNIYIGVLLIVVIVGGVALAYNPVFLGADKSSTTQLISGRTLKGCHTAIGQDRVSCGTIRLPGSTTNIDAPAENFIIQHLDPAKGTFAIKSEKTGLFCTDINGRLICRTPEIGTRETFTAERVSDKRLAIKAYSTSKDKRYCSDANTNIDCNNPRGMRGNWEVFTATNPDAFFPSPPSSTGTIVAVATGIALVGAGAGALGYLRFVKKP